MLMFCAVGSPVLGESVFLSGQEKDYCAMLSSYRENSDEIY